MDVEGLLEQASAPALLPGDDLGISPIDVVVEIDGVLRDGRLLSLQMVTRIFTL